MIPPGEGFNGRGVQTGPMRPDWGPDAFDAVCDICGATWLALAPEEPCWWCQRRLERVIAEQRDILLAGVDHDPSDARWRSAMDAWKERLVVAVEAGIITAAEARSAWNRAERSRVA